MQFPRGRWRGAGEAAVFFFKPREVGLGGAGGEGAERWRGKRRGRVSTHSAPFAFGFCAPGAARGDRWARSREDWSFPAGFA